MKRKLKVNTAAQQRPFRTEPCAATAADIARANRKERRFGNRAYEPREQVSARIEANPALALAPPDWWVNHPDEHVILEMLCRRMDRNTVLAVLAGATRRADREGFIWTPALDAITQRASRLTADEQTALGERADKLTAWISECTDSDELGRLATFSYYRISVAIALVGRAFSRPLLQNLSWSSEVCQAMASNKGAPPETLHWVLSAVGHFLPLRANGVDVPDFYGILKLALCLTESGQTLSMRAILRIVRRLPELKPLLDPQEQELLVDLLVRLIKKGNDEMLQDPTRLLPLFGSGQQEIWLAAWGPASRAGLESPVLGPDAV